MSIRDKLAKAREIEDRKVEEYNIQKAFEDTSVYDFGLGGDHLASVMRGSAPVPRRKAAALSNVVRYTERLFAHFMAGEENSPEAIAEKIERDIIEHLKSPILSGYEYHATKQEIRETIRERLGELLVAMQTEPKVFESPIQEVTERVRKPLDDPFKGEAKTETPTLPALSPNSISGEMKPIRLSAMINSPIAARRLEKYLFAHRGVSQSQFALMVPTTDRTLRSFRKTGKVRRDIFEGIAKAMACSTEDLLKE